MPDELPTHLKEPHERLRWLRERKKFPTPKDAAVHFGWGYNTYKSHENGNRGINARNVGRYAKAFKVPAVWILHGTVLDAPQLSDDERMVLEAYRRLDPRTKRRALRFLVDEDADQEPGTAPDKVASTG